MPVTVAPVTTGTGSEESRAFFQERLRFYFGWLFVLSFGFYLVTLTGVATVAVWRDWRSAVDAPHAAHLTASLLAGLSWVALGARAWPIGPLRWLDCAALAVAGCAFAAMGSFYALSREATYANPVFGIHTGLLACTHTTFLRALAVPSRARVTALVSSGAVAPVMAAAVWLLLASRVALPRDQGVPVLIILGTWCAIAVAASAVGSFIIFGLRRAVAQARQIGQYTLDAKIGEGGMGVVYRARHALLRRPTAIKLLPPERAGLVNVKRFEREVQQTARLTHPNTVAIYDYGRTPDGVFYYAMELLDGVTLEELVRSGGPVPPARIIHVLRQVCSALAEAHDLGLVHRDIKPANIILTERGGESDVVKVVDFGLVRLIDTRGTAETATAVNVLTGTPLYMAPEAIRSEETVDGRSDLYALGAVGYFLLTGLPVFEGRTVMEICAHHLHTAPARPSQRTQTPVPGDLEDLVMRCLAKSPDARPPTARALRTALDRCADAGGWSPEEASRWWAAWRSSPHPPRWIGSDATTPGHPPHTVAVDLDARLQDDALTRGR